MPQLDPRIPMSGELPQARSPLGIIGDVRAMQKAAAEMRAEEEQRRAQAEMQQIIERSGGDFDVAIKALSVKYPQAALKLQEEVGKNRKAIAEAVKLQQDNDDAMLTMGAQIAQSITDEPSFQIGKKLISALNPEIAQYFGESYDPARVAQLLAAGTKIAEQNKVKREGLNDVLSGKWEDGLGKYLSTAQNDEQWQQAIVGAKALGMPKALLDRFPKQYSPEAAQQAGLMAMSPEKRAELAGQAEGRDIQRSGQLLSAANTQADNARQAAASAETKRHNMVMEQLQRVRDSKPPGQRELTPNAALLTTRQLRNDFNRETKAASEIERQLAIMKSSIDAVKKGAATAGSQGVLVTFQKILDPTSVVRESEYARSASGLSLFGRLEGQWMKLQQGGAGVTTADLEQFVNLAEDWAKKQRQFTTETKAQIDSIADEFGLKKELITRDIGQPGDKSAPASGPKEGDTRGIQGGGTAQFKGGKWVRIK